MSAISIIIPTYNRIDLLQRCVESIRQHTALPYEIVIVDNASTDGTGDWCRREGIIFLSMPKNEGFTIACNKGLQLCSGDTIVLLNNDTVVTDNWLSNMHNALCSSKDVGIVGPVTNYASGSQQVNYPFEDLAEFQRIASQVNRSDSSKWRRVERIVGICFVFKRSLMETIGLLDERFSPGHYEDDDFCLRTRMHGFSLIVCHDSLIYHEGSASFKREGVIEQQLLVERNYRKFMDKWHLDPRAFI
jgi:GT2 family glycosyltransferase